MAKYIVVKEINMMTYALDECEDYLVINAYLQIVGSGKFKEDKHIKLFEYYHLQNGGTLNDNILLRMNGYLRTLGIEALVFVNGHTTNFAAIRGSDKIQRRQNILEQLKLMPDEARADLIARKEIEASLLPERNPEYATSAPKNPGHLLRSEQDKRRAAVAESQRNDAKIGRPLHNILEAARLPIALKSRMQADQDAEDAEFVPESTTQDNVVELVSEMHNLRAEVAALKTILQSVFKNV